METCVVRRGRRVACELRLGSGLVVLGLGALGAGRVVAGARVGECERER